MCIVGRGQLAFGGEMNGLRKLVQRVKIEGGEDSINLVGFFPIFIGSVKIDNSYVLMRKVKE